MVQFNTRVYTEQEGQIIGAEVTVYSDSGDRIGVIDVADATTLNELKAQLAVIDETYFTEERLQAILANSQETNNINATSLNGFISSDFAKVSQLSSYAPVSHNHTKKQITDLYNYQITASKYNVDIDTDVTITVKVTNQQGNPVVGVTVPVLKDNQSWKSGTTGVNGTFSLTYTADTWGLVMFSANTSNIQCNVTGWRQYYNDSNYSVKYNNELVNVVIHTGTANVPTSWVGWHNILNDTSLRPSMPVSETDTSGSILIKASNNSPQITFKSITGSAVSGQIYGELLWRKK